MELLGEHTFSEETDALGYYDIAEHIAGLAFVACQTYMSIVCGSLNLKKVDSLSKGQIHSSGCSKISLINHAANYWKHNNEWTDINKDKRCEIIIKALESLNINVNTSYPLSCMLRELSHPKPASFAVIANILRDWVDSILLEKQ